MTAIGKFQEMREFAKYIESAGYEVRVMQNGVLEVQDPVRSSANGIEHKAVFLNTPQQARKFINDRS